MPPKGKKQNKKTSGDKAATKNANAKKSGGNKGKTKFIDYAAEEFFEPQRILIDIEHSDECPIFREKAYEFQQYVQLNYPDRTVTMIRNDNGKLIPRVGSFEIIFSQNARSPKHLIWSGVAKGPPRCDKFPIPFDIILSEIRTIMNKIYVDINAKQAIDSLDMIQDDNDENEETGLAEGGAADGEYVDLNAGDNTYQDENETFA